MFQIHSKTFKTEERRTEREESTLSASKSAPASILNSPVSGSRTTVAVRPAADEALPDV
jgi:hypothetical protein